MSTNTWELWEEIQKIFVTIYLSNGRRKTKKHLLKRNTKHIFVNKSLSIVQRNTKNSCQQILKYWAKKYKTNFNKYLKIVGRNTNNICQQMPEYCPKKYKKNICQEEIQDTYLSTNTWELCQPFFLASLQPPPPPLLLASPICLWWWGWSWG